MVRDKYVMLKDVNHAAVSVLKRYFSVCAISPIYMKDIQPMSSHTENEDQSNSSTRTL